MPNLPRTRDLVAGRWDDLLLRLAPELTDAINALSRSCVKHVPCPVHGGRTKFRLFPDGSGGGVCNDCGKFSDGFDLLKWLRGWDFAEAAKRVDEALEDLGPPVIEKPKREEPDWEARRRALNHLWATGRYPDLVEQYLKGRGLSGKLPMDVRGVRAMSYRDDDAPGIYPGMLALIRRPDGRPASLHRTYFADVEQRKKVMPPIDTISGGAIRLYPATKGVALTEGIETAIAVHEHNRIPVWACVTANGLRKVELPEEFRHVVIFADNDRTGRQAAYECAARMEKEDRRATVHIPPLEGADWLDYYQSKGAMNG